ncbi:hypothetical protein GOODEAATRI_008572 [Goodea atripinnis]|uniref:Uncharacterized protein n=1 Tax=Goodea atripinnis TaxID=208336 RepID=A0ABV0P2Q2_9TELE
MLWNSCNLNYSVLSPHEQFTCWHFCLFWPSLSPSAVGGVLSNQPRGQRGQPQIYIYSHYISALDFSSKLNSKGPFNLTDLLQPTQQIHKNVRMRPSEGSAAHG